MMKRSKFMRLAAIVAVFLFAGSVHAADETITSPWVEGFNNKLRLIAGGSQEDLPGEYISEIGIPRLYAGIEIEMPEGWKTYWRAPGESGIPPEFDFAGSENLKSARVLYPAPHRLTDKGGTIAGYKKHVTFPIAFHANDTSKPVVLKVKAAYGVCKEICVPAEAEASITIQGTHGGLSDAVDAAAKSVPWPGGAIPKLEAWRVNAADSKPRLALDVELSADATDGDAFVDMADGTYLPLPKKTNEQPGKAGYEVDLTDGVDFKTLKGKTIRVTLTSSKGNSEHEIKID